MDSLKIAELKRAHQEFFKTNKNQKIKSRVNYLKKLKRVIDGNENLIFEALSIFHPKTILFPNHMEIF